MADLEEGTQVLVRELASSPLEAIESLNIEAQPAPEPAAGDVVVRVRAAQVNWVDLIMLSGQYQHVPEPPYVPGLEWSGEVVAVGAEVTRFGIGDAVIGDGLLTGPRSLSAYRAHGGFATYTLAPESALIPLPERLSFAHGCSLLGGYETAYHCLFHRGASKAGETVLIGGATGSVGLAALQLAKHAGLTTVATSRSEEKLRVLESLGADHVVQTSEGWHREMKRRFPEGVDVVYDPVGGSFSTSALRCLRFGGRFLIVGWSSTPFAARKEDPNQLPTNLIMMKSADVLGCPAVISAHKDPSIRPRRLKAILEAVDAGAIRPVIGETHPLSAIRDAMRAKWESRVVGSIVVEP